MQFCTYKNAWWCCVSFWLPIVIAIQSVQLVFAPRWWPFDALEQNIYIYILKQCSFTVRPWAPRWVEVKYFAKFGSRQIFSCLFRCETSSRSNSIWQRNLLNPSWRCCVTSSNWSFIGQNLSKIDRMMRSHRKLARFQSNSNWLTFHPAICFFYRTMRVQKFAAKQKSLPGILKKVRVDFLGVPSRKLTYPTTGKGKSSSKLPFDGIC